MKSYDEIKKYLENSALNLKTKLNPVDLDELAEVIISYDGDGGCAARHFYDLLDKPFCSNPEIINTVVAKVVGSLESKIANNEDVDYGKVTQHIYAALDCKEYLLNKDLQKRLCSILEGKKFRMSVITGNFINSFMWGSMVKTNYTNKKNLYEGLTK